jgi:hypothetical protein
MRPFRVILALVLAAGSAFAQTGSPGQGATAAAASPAAQPEVPFVSRLRAEVVESGIRLTWKDSPDVVGTCLIYRSAAPITAQNLGSATLAGTVGSGVETWVDTPPDANPYFYAVVMQDARGTRYPLAIPYRNVTGEAVALAPGQPAVPAEEAASPPAATAPTPSTTQTAAVPAPAAPAAAAPSAPAPAAAAPQPAAGSARPSAAPPPPAGEPARITGIAATLAPSGDAVTVTFASSNPARDLLLFWSSAPIATPLDLLSAGSATTLDPGTTRYVLPAAPGSSYWFAVLDAGLYRVGQTPLVQGFNTTSTPVEVPGQAALAGSGSRRVSPLPTLGVSLGSASGSPDAGSDIAALPAPEPVSAATEAAIQQLLKDAGQAPKPAPSPAFLPGDQGAQSGAGADGLVDIVQGSFSHGDMGGAQQKLLGYLSVPRSQQAAARARFYLGQSDWFLGKTREALLEFLSASELYYQESQPWIDAALETLEAEDSVGR